MARDAVGVKPLYYFNNEKYFSFCSEIKGINSILGKNNELDFESLSNYLFLLESSKKFTPSRSKENTTRGSIKSKKWQDN